MSTPTPTPRPALKATGMRRRHARCPEAELGTLTTERDHWQKIAVSASREREHNANIAQAMTAERDQLRAEVNRLRSDRDCEKRLRKDADEFRENAIARAERAEDNLAALEQCHDDNCREVVRIADELATAKERLRSEATDDYAAIKDLQRELATERAIVSRIWTQLGSPTYEQLKGRSIYDLIDELKADYDLIDELKAELAKERARLDWVFRNCKVFAADYTIHDREDLGAAMKEHAK